jgi:hypothetical protein
MAGAMYVAAFEESDGSEYEYVIHATDVSEAERRARHEAGRRGATLVGVRRALPSNEVVEKWRRARVRAGSLVMAAVLVPTFALGALLVLRAVARA